MFQYPGGGGQYVLKKLKALWIPFFAGNAIFVLLNNEFVNVGIYADNNLPGQIADTYQIQSIHSIYDFYDIVKHLTKNLLFCGDTELGGATWFFRTMFVVSTLWVLSWIVCNHLQKNHKKIFGIILSAFIAGLTWWISVRSAKFPFGLHSVLAAFLAVEFGYAMKKMNIYRVICKKPIIATLSSTIILLIMNSCGRISLNVGLITNPIYYMISSCAGFTLVLSLYFIIPSSIVQMFTFLGKRTISIVLLHFLCFKMITFVYILSTGIDKRALAAFPVLPNKHLWPAYIVAGVGIPMFTTWIVQLLLTKLFVRKHDRG